MNIVVDRCGDSASPRNTGVAKQCLYAPTIGYALATEDQSFADLAAFRSKTAWDADKMAKKIAVMFSVEKSVLSNVEATFYEARTVKVKTKSARKGITFTHHLGLCSHGALQSYENSNFTRIYEFTADGDIKGIIQEDGSIKGQSLSAFLVGDILEPVLEGDPQSTVVGVVYKNAKELTTNGAIVTPDFDPEDYKGIYPLNLSISGTPTATSLVVSVGAGCDGIPFGGLDLSDFVAKRADGSDQTSALTSMTAGTGANLNIYTFVTTGLVSGSIETIVKAQTLAMYQSDQPAPFTI